MKKAQINRLITNAYNRLCWAVESDSTADQWVSEATRLAVAGEKNHRGNLASTYPITASQAAKYFVARYVAKGPGERNQEVSWERAAEHRDDIRIAYACHQRMDRRVNEQLNSGAQNLRMSENWGSFQEAAAEMDAAIDYTRDIAGNDA